ncbi:hypothetical protein ACH9EU_07160 [Kocuria sp. M1R5S2]|uniref:hypothetical protein n=1 Tax=Kocuria rhizosphaerae TaxID=3376285 RepID=UPI003795423E
MSSTPSPSARPSPRKSPRKSPGTGRRQRTAVPLAESGSQRMTLRRAPNVWAFVVLGGLLGALVGVLVGLSGAGNAQFTQGAVTLFMVSVFTVLGLGAGAVTALVLDRISVSRARPVTTEVVDEDTPADGSADGPRPTDPRA